MHVLHYRLRSSPGHAVRFILYSVIVISYLGGEHYCGTRGVQEQAPPRPTQTVRRDRPARPNDQSEDKTEQEINLVDRADRVN